MQFRQIWANLPVEDTKRTEKFYTHLGLKLNMAATTEELTSFLFSEGNFVIHFFRKDKLEFAMNDKASNTENGSEIIFSISAKTQEEVDTWATKAEEVGGKIFKKSGRQEDGYYYCVFADPDGHKFNVLLMEGGM